MKICVLRPTVRCGSKVFGSAASPILTSPGGAARAGAARARSTAGRHGAMRRMSIMVVLSGAGAAALDLDDDVAKPLGADVAEGVAQRALVPAHDLARRHLDAVHAAVGV